MTAFYQTEREKEEYLKVNAGTIIAGTSVPVMSSEQGGSALENKAEQPWRQLAGSWKSLT